MSIDVLEQVRQLATAFDEFVDDVTVDEAIGHVETTAEAERPTPLRSRVYDIEDQPAWGRFGLAAAAVFLVAGLVGALVWVDRAGSELASSTTPPATQAPAPTVSFGQFVWPAPARGYATFDELVAAFTSEVLSWEGYGLGGPYLGQSEPQSFTLNGPTPDARVQVIAIPSPEGWGFVQIGLGLSASIDERGTVALDFPTTSTITSSSVTVRFTDGTSINTTSTSNHVELPDTQLERLVSALVIGRDSNGTAIAATGGQFNTDASVAPTTIPTNALGVPYGPLDYATTDSWLPLWPETSASDPPATTTGYGMHLCDSGYGTKILRVEPTAGPAHAYTGTLCVFIDLATPRPEAITMCATSTEKFNYARCQRRTDLTDSTGAGTAVPTLASETQQAAMAAFPTATTWDQPDQYTFDLSAATGTGDAVDFDDGTVGVTITQGTTGDAVDTPAVCFLIELAGATANGCAGNVLLATGLAYGAFQDGDGPIEIIGIVPDDVTAVDIDGTTLTPTNNVWHYTATPGNPLKITVRSADGRTASTR